MTEHNPLREPPPRLLDGASLFLDLDGTILDLADSPDGVVVSDGLRALLTAASERLAGRLAIISGRCVDDVARLLPGIDLNIAGSHGAEMRWARGPRNQPARPAALDEALARMRELQAANPGLLVENKPFGAAIHYRSSPQLGPACRALAEQLAHETGLPLQVGKMVYELKASAATKGDALATFMAEAPFCEGVPVFLGDDDNDEPAFAAAERIGGAGVLVGELRPTLARWRLDSVADAHVWLRTGLGVRA